MQLMSDEQHIKPLSEILQSVINTLQGHQQISLKELLEMIGEHGLLMLCILLCLPFLLPVSVPGISTVFGLVIILIGVGIMLNRLPPIPERLLHKTFSATQLAATLEKGLGLIQKIEKMSYPRLTKFTEGVSMNRFNGFMLIFAGVLLMFPLSFIPFSNTLPGWGIILLAAGMLQRDGYLVLAGYGFIVATTLYFSVLAWLAAAGIMRLVG